MCNFIHSTSFVGLAHEGRILHLLLRLFAPPWTMIFFCARLKWISQFTPLQLRWWKHKKSVVVQANHASLNSSRSPSAMVSPSSLCNESNLVMSVSSAFRDLRWWEANQRYLCDICGKSSHPRMYICIISIFMLNFLEYNPLILLYTYSVELPFDRLILLVVLCQVGN